MTSLCLLCVTASMQYTLKYGSIFVVIRFKSSMKFVLRLSAREDKGEGEESAAYKATTHVYTYTVHTDTFTMQERETEYATDLWTSIIK